MSVFRLIIQLAFGLVVGAISLNGPRVDRSRTATTPDSLRSDRSTQSAGTDGDLSDASLVWRNVGPARVGGIVADIAVPLPVSSLHPRAGTVMYVAGPGGLFKT